MIMMYRVEMYRYNPGNNIVNSELKAVAPFPKIVAYLKKRIGKTYI